MEDQMSSPERKPADPVEAQRDFHRWPVAHDRPRAKGGRARQAWVATCARLLAAEPFDRLTIAVLGKSAGMAHGTFRVRFETLSTISAEVFGLLTDRRKQGRQP
jgi:hypothetical protein